MVQQIIGRESEKSRLKQALSSDKSELIAIYGRRRVGKTFLIREFFKKEIVFEVSGLADGSMPDQIENFHKALSKVSKKAKGDSSQWLAIFTELENYLDTIRSKKKKVVFIDEFPWMDTPRSKFLMAFENFWNSYCTKRKDLIVVVCGSAASYMVKKIIKNKKGLHNRISQKIRLLPFNLKETHLFLKKKGIQYTQYDVLQLYMTIGGVPHYLDKLQRGYSVAQNIDYLCFEKDGVLQDEFDILYASLFNHSEKHTTIVKTLAKTNKGLNRKDLLKQSGLASGGDFSLRLSELIESGFISEQDFYQKKKKQTLYRLSDEYSKFYLKFIEPNKKGGKGTWLNLHKKQSYTSWSGFAFEVLCLKHIEQIKKGLGIEAIYSVSSCWYNEQAQIDLLIDRDDSVMNLCELKFYNGSYTISKKYYQELKNKIVALQREISSKKNIYLTMISTYGVKENEYSKELMQSELDMDCLFGL